MHKVILLDDNILIYAGNELINTVKSLQYFPNDISKEHYVFIYERTERGEGDNSDAFSMPWYGKEYTFDEKEEAKIERLLKDKFSLQSLKNAYVVVLYKSVFASEIKCVYSILHEFRHIQQFIFDEEIHEIILDIMDVSSSDCYWDLPFELDAIIYAKEKLTGIGFSKNDIQDFIKNRYPKRASKIMERTILDIEYVIKCTRNYYLQRKQ